MVAKHARAEEEEDEKPSAALASAAKRPRQATGDRVGIHIFTRDLRVEDNRGLYALASKVDTLRLFFVFTPEQCKSNPYFGDHSFAFLLASLRDLRERISLAAPGGAGLEVYFGTHAAVLRRCFEEDGNIVAVSIAEDYTPYARLRHGWISQVCQDSGVEFFETEDNNLVTNLTAVRSGVGTVYKVFTPWYKNVSQRYDFPTPDYSGAKALEKLWRGPRGESEDAYSIDRAIGDFLPACNGSSFVDSYFEGKDYSETASGSLTQVLGKKCRATRDHALQQLKAYDFDSYNRNRDNVANDCTLLSPHLKFGLVSAREVVHIVKGRKDVQKANKESFVREVLFRDFYMYITFHFPWVLAGMRNQAVQPGAAAGPSGEDRGADCPAKGEVWSNQNFIKDYTVDDVEWEKDPGDTAFKAWCEGKTGVPLVDASMREVNATGFMHNRGRMVVAMFLTKNLLIDWRKGERYFAQKLVDYDPMSNNGGWQWSSSTGADGSPYFRIMNPQSQMIKVDPADIYVKKYVGELKRVAKKDLNKWEEKKVRDKYIGNKLCPDFAYIAPMVDLKSSRQKAIEVFKRAGRAAKA